ncbi:hypothetical protein [Streptomyces sp. NPDC047453]|uniref:hypothetical protein n=1 Tax=Streptomyces sp. NPDC047453 TaxID=3154812 RepID=UPI0033EFF2FD
MSESTTPQAALGELLDESRHEAGYCLRDAAKRACRVLVEADQPHGVREGRR